MGEIAVAGDGGQYGHIAAATCAHFRVEGGAEVELIFCTPDEIRALNARMRGVDKETDVLSFPALTLHAGKYAPFTAENFPFDINPESGRVLLGSVAICNEVAERQAEEYGHGAAREKGYLFLHGLLHVLGFDHVEESDKAKMRAAEEEILCALGLVR